MNAYFLRINIGLKTNTLCVAIALLSIIVAMPPAIRAAEYVEIRTELNSTWQSPPRTNHYRNTATCIVSTNDWFISGDFLSNAQVDYWLIGTNIVEHRIITSSMDLQRAKDFVSEKILGKNPTSPIPGSYPRAGETFTRISLWPQGQSLDYGVERAVWLAFCSGSYLKQNGRKIPMPIGPSSRAFGYSDPFGYSDKTVVFGDDLGLPKSVELYATNGQLVCQYEVLERTNFLGRTFPLKFRLVQYGQAHNVNTKFTESKSELLGRVTSIQTGRQPELPDEVRNKLGK